MVTRKREHSRKPDELYDIIEQCSPGPYLELFARHKREGWSQWGNEVDHPTDEMPIQDDPAPWSVNVLPPKKSPVPLASD